MFYVYVLWSRRLRKRYVGCTEDLKTRLRAHNSGHSKFTKAGIPWQVVLVEEFETRTEARKRENYLKSGAGRAWLDLRLPDYCH